MVRAAGLFSDTDIANHRRVTDAVHAEGGHIAMQILHAGRYAYGKDCVAPSAIKSPISPFAPRELDEDGIEQQIRDIATAAARAVEAGYDGVEVPPSSTTNGSRPAAPPALGRRPVLTRTM